MMARKGHCLALLCRDEICILVFNIRDCNKMTKTDAVAIFAEGTFEDQVRALLAVHLRFNSGKSTDH